MRLMVSLFCYSVEGKVDDAINRRRRSRPLSEAAQTYRDFNTNTEDRCKEGY